MSLSPGVPGDPDAHPDRRPGRAGDHDGSLPPSPPPPPLTPPRSWSRRSRPLQQRSSATRPRTDRDRSRSPPNVLLAAEADLDAPVARVVVVIDTDRAIPGDDSAEVGRRAGPEGAASSSEAPCVVALAPVPAMGGPSATVAGGRAGPLPGRRRRHRRARRPRRGHRDRPPVRRPHPCRHRLLSARVGHLAELRPLRPQTSRQILSSQPLVSHTTLNRPPAIAD